MPIVRPRLTDYHGILLPQAQADFAIPFLDEDIPLYLDPFLLWRSPSQQDNALHTAIINSFNHLGYLEKQGKRAEAVEILTTITECDEVGFGHSHTREGRRIGKSQAEEILQLFRAIPDYDRRGFTHFEEIQFFVDHISRDRISDIGCNLLKSFLIDYTIQQCQEHRIPTTQVSVPAVYSYRENMAATTPALRSWISTAGPVHSPEVPPARQSVVEEQSYAAGCTFQSPCLAVLPVVLGRTSVQ